jgi:hypothetical protein
VSAEPKWLEANGKADWQRDVCKHCGLDIVSPKGMPHTWSHAEGYQRGKHRCAVEPYGYDASPERDPCSFACLGSVTGIEGRVEMTDQ